MVFHSLYSSENIMLFRCGIDHSIYGTSWCSTLYLLNMNTELFISLPTTIRDKTLDLCQNNVLKESAIKEICVQYLLLNI